MWGGEACHLERPSDALSRQGYAIDTFSAELRQFWIRTRLQEESTAGVRTEAHPHPFMVRACVGVRASPR